MRTALAITALLLATPATAACHHYSKWMYPWPQPSCSIRHPHVQSTPTPLEAPPAASEPSLDVFTARWSAAAADAAQRNLTPACGDRHCSLEWIDATGATTMLFSYVDGMRIVCTDDNGPTIECLKSDGTEQKVEVKELHDE
jgi:hypothetical protein